MFGKMKELMDMQQKAKEVQKSLAAMTVSKEALGGKIRIVMNGHYKVESIAIDETLLAPDQKKNLETLLADLITATSEAIREKSVSETMGLMKGMKIPGL